MVQNHYRADSQSIGKEYKLLLAVLIKVDYSTDLVWILLHCQLTGHIADSIRLDSWFRRETALPLHWSEVIVCLSSDNKVGSSAFNVMETFEIIVTSVVDVERVLFIRNDIHCLCIMNLCWSYVKESEYLRLKIIQSVYLDSSFPLSEQSPFKGAQT